MFGFSLGIDVRIDLCEDFVSGSLEKECLRFWKFLGLGVEIV